MTELCSDRLKVWKFPAVVNESVSPVNSIALLVYFVMSFSMFTSPAAVDAVQVWLSYGFQDVDHSASGLTASERELAERLTSNPRRRSFEMGRRLGKRAVQEFTEPSGIDAERVEILSEDPAAITSRPVICEDGTPVDLKISITHLDQTVAVAVADGEHVIGIDLARIQRPSSAFRDIWMKTHEQYQVSQSEDVALTATMNWSAREAAFKATGIDSHFRPAHWSVAFEGDRATCFYRGQQQPVQLSFYRIHQEMLLTVAGDGTDVTFRTR
ncbi:MAG: 4'-phosphopantetheinyl transferase superfamily protein [Fuerstiella sp.]|nr:4'-phosphopantetheinyl transferase superfamily protein [Fuerstiella sp.]